MNTYEVVFQAMGTRVNIQADRYYGPGDGNGLFITFSVGSGTLEEYVGTFYLSPGDYVRLINTESEDNCSHSKECSKDDDWD